MLGVRCSIFTAHLRPSRFLEDFPVELVEEWNIGNSDPWADNEPF